MTAMNELLELKEEALSAKEAAYVRSVRGFGWVALAWAAWLSGVMIGLFLILKAAYSGSFWLDIAGVGVLAVSAFLVTLPTIIRVNDKELKRLNEVASATTESYRNALLTEASTYGIDHDGRSDRTGFMEPDYEFTALRNGDPVDVTVREFNGEIVFMLNGERMRKQVVV